MPRTKNTISEFTSKIDRLPSRVRMYEKIEGNFDAIASFYGFEKIAASPIEDSQLFNILVKAGFLKKDPPVFCKTRNGVEFILQPSGAISLLRMYTPHKMNDLPHPFKVCFRGTRFFLDTNLAGDPLKTQEEKGLLMVGEEGSLAEAEIIFILWKGLLASGIESSEIGLKINATGCEICRPSFRSSFTSYFRSRQAKLCKNCKEYLKDAPTKILKCREERCGILANHAPQILDFLCEGCKKHLRSILEFLEEMHIPFSLDHRFFYEGFWLDTFIFEFFSEKNLPENYFLFGEGGRMSNVAELIIGKKIAVASGTIFLDALGIFLHKKGVAPPEVEKPYVFIVQLGELAKRKSLGIIEKLRSIPISTGEILGRDSVKTQLKIAERVGAKLALIIGQKEAIDGTIIVREIESGTQETIPQEKMAELLKRKLKK